MDRSRVAVLAAGAVASLCGLALALVPGLTERAPFDTLAGAIVGVDRTPAVLLAASAVGGYTLLAAWAEGRSQTVDPKAFDRLRDRPPEAARSETTARTAARVDATIDWVVDEGERTGDLTAELTATAAAAYAAATGTDRATARAAVETGAWTDDPVAAAVLGAGSPPLAARLRLWLVPHRERRRRIERTIAAIERVRVDE